jgi:hypothetical protein
MDHEENREADAHHSSPVALFPVVARHVLYALAIANDDTYMPSKAGEGTKEATPPTPGQRPRDG